MTKPRNYKKEYGAFHALPEQKKRRAQRNAARRKMVKAGDGKDVDHKDKDTTNDSRKNLRVMSASKNRSLK